MDEEDVGGGATYPWVLPWMGGTFCVHVYGNHYFDSWNQNLQYKPHILNAGCISANRAEHVSRGIKVYCI